MIEEEIKLIHNKGRKQAPQIVADFVALSYPYANVGLASVDVSAIPNCNIIQITHLYVIQIYVQTVLRI